MLESCRSGLQQFLQGFDCPTSRLPSRLVEKGPSRTPRRSLSTCPEIYKILKVLQTFDANVKHLTKYSKGFWIFGWWFPNSLRICYTFGYMFESVLQNAWPIILECLEQLFNVYQKTGHIHKQTIEHLVLYIWPCIQDKIMLFNYPWSWDWCVQPPLAYGNMDKQEWANADAHHQPQQWHHLG